MTTPAPPAARPETVPTRSSGGARTSAALKVLFTIMVVVLIGRFATQFDWPLLWERVKSADGRLLAAAVALLVARFVIWQTRWTLALRRLGVNTSPLLALWVLLASLAVNLITPTVRVFGGLFRARHLSVIHATPFAAVYGSVLFDQLSHHVVISSITSLSFIAVAFHLGHARIASIAIVVILCVLVVLVAWVRKQGADGARSWAAVLAEWAGRRGPRVQHLIKGGRKVIRTIRQLLADPKLRVQVLVLGGGIFLCNAGAMWVIFLALENPIPLLLAAATIGVGTAAGFMTGTPGGVGTTEAAMVAVFVSLGVSQLDAVAATLLYRGLHYAVILGLGAPGLLYLEATHDRRVERTGPITETTDPIYESEHPEIP